MRSNTSGNCFNHGTKVTRGENGILNGTLTRYPNEFVRHKTLDLIGDLMLVGHPIKGHILAARSGHKANIELAKKIRAYWEKTPHQDEIPGQAD